MAEIVTMQQPEKKRDILFETIADVCDIDITQLTKSARGALNKACSELREIDPPQEEIRRRAEIYRERYQGIHLTPNALVKHWPSLNEKAHENSTPTGTTGKIGRAAAAFERHERNR